MKKKRGSLSTHPCLRLRPDFGAFQRSFLSSRRPGRIRMHARWPRASLCPCSRRPPFWNRVRCWHLVLPAAPPKGLGAVPSRKKIDERGGGRRQSRERRGAAWQNPSAGRAASAPEQAASELPSCDTVRTSWYGEVAGRKKCDAGRRAKLCGEFRAFGQ
jgi:hypothetical protein